MARLFISLKLINQFIAFLNFSGDKSVKKIENMSKNIYDFF